MHRSPWLSHSRSSRGVRQGPQRSSLCPPGCTFSLRSATTAIGTEHLTTRDPKNGISAEIFFYSAGHGSILLLCNQPQEQSVLGVSKRLGTNHQSPCYQQTVLTSWCKVPWNSSDLWLQSNMISISIFHSLTSGLQQARTLAKQLRSIPGLLESTSHCRPNLVKNYSLVLWLIFSFKITLKKSFDIYFFHLKNYFYRTNSQEWNYWSKSWNSGSQNVLTNIQKHPAKISWRHYLRVALSPHPH